MNKSLSHLHQLLLDKGIAFVCYSLPGISKAITLISYHPISFLDLSYLADNKEDGFVFAPFEINEKSPIWFLKTDIIIDEKTDILAIEKDLEALSDVNQKSNLDLDSTSKSIYSQTFEVFLKELKLKKLDKVILSRIVTEPRSGEELFEIYERMSASYESAFTYWIQLPTGEIWMGATPELLLKQNESGLKTMALAGTQVLNNRNVGDVIWENKEIEEQAYVRNYVQKVLSVFSDSVEASETFTTQAGNLAHLRTNFTVNQSFEQSKIIELVKRLHPTPAVCGIPLEASKKLILKEENHNRSYYTGFLGLIKKEAISLFVNLRCMQVLPEKFALYVGGGITRDSEMEKEWKETEAKAQTLLSVIG